MKHGTLVNCAALAALILLGCDFQPVQRLGGDAATAEPGESAERASTVADEDQAAKPPPDFTPPSQAPSDTPTLAEGEFLRDFFLPAGVIWGTCESAPARSRLSVTSSPIDEWVSALRERPRSELVEAGEEALPILLAAIQDPDVPTWLMMTLDGAKPDDEWLLPVYVAGLSSANWHIQRECLQRLREFGRLVQPFIPAIVESLQTVSSEWDVFFVPQAFAFLDDVGASNAEYLKFARSQFSKLRPRSTAQGVPLPGHGGGVDHDVVFKAIVSVGPEALPILFEIIRDNQGALDEPESSLSHSVCWRLDADFQPGILLELQSSEPNRRRAAAWLISMQSNPDANWFLSESVLAELVPRLDDEDVAVRRHLLKIFDRQAPEASEAVPALAARLTDADRVNARTAAGALGRIGVPALAEIRKAVESEDPVLRTHGAAALASIDPLPASELDLMVRLAQDANLEVRRTALRGLSRAHEVTPEVIAALSAASNDPATEGLAAAVLAQIGPPALPVLIEALEKASPQQRIAVARAIWKIDPSSTIVIPTMTAVFEANEGTAEAVAAARALGEMKSAAAPAVGALLQEIAPSRPRELRAAAMDALAEIGPAAEEAVPALIEITTEEEDWIRSYAIDALRTILPASSWGEHPPRYYPAGPAVTPQVKRRVPHRPASRAED